MKTCLSSPENKAKTKAAIFVIPIILVIVAAVVYSAFVNQPMFSDANNSATTTSIVSSCAYDIWYSQTNVYLNNGLHLHFSGNINLLVGANYTVTYRTDSLRMISWRLVN